MAGTNGHSNEPKRKPFKKGEREQTYALLAKHVLQLDDLKEKRKKVEEKLETLKDDIREGGYLEDDQGTLAGLDEQDDGDEARA